MLVTLRPVLLFQSKMSKTSEIQIKWKQKKEWTLDNSIYNLQILLHYIGELSLSQEQSSFASEFCLLEIFEP